MAARCDQQKRTVRGIFLNFFCFALRHGYAALHFSVKTSNWSGFAPVMMKILPGYKKLHENIATFVKGVVGKSD